MKKQGLEQILCAACEQDFPEIIGNEPFVFGTIDRKDWKRGQQEKLDSKQMIECTYPFKDVWIFDVEPGDWVLEPETKK